jgi:GT2 family glycosyltransferase
MKSKIQSGRFPLVSVIVVNYNGAKFINRCLSSLFKTDYPNFEVIFVDNASTDGSIEYAREKFGDDSRLKFVVNDRNYGFAEGNNIGFRHADGDYIVFLNNDTEVDSNWLKELIKVMKSDPTIGVGQCKSLWMYNPALIDNAGAFMDPLGYTYIRGFGKDRNLYGTVEEVFQADGASMIVKRDVVDDVTLGDGPFDSDYFAYYDDVDLSWRVKLRGYKIVCVPTAIIYHARGRGHSKIPAHLVFHACKNHLMNIIKNYSFSNLIKWFLPCLFIELGNVYLDIVRGEFKHGLARYKAILWNLINMKKIWEKRLVVQHFIRRVPDSYLTKHMVRFDPRYLLNHQKAMDSKLKSMITHHQRF